MYERRSVDGGVFSKLEFLEFQRYVLVNKFSEESYKTFVRDCEKVINSGQGFLPIVIDSYGGFVYSLLGMIDFLSHLDIEVYTVCESKAMSCGAILFSCGVKRYMGQSATIMVHDVSGYLWGKDVDLQNDTKEISRLNRKIYRVLDSNTGQKSGYWKGLIIDNKFADLYLTSKTATSHNLATGIGLPHIETSVQVTSELVL